MNGGPNNIQLLPGTKKRLGLKVRGENRFLYIGSAILGAVLAVGFWYQYESTNLRNEISDLDDELVRVEARRDSGTENSIIDVGRRLSLISNMLDEHIYWTKAIAKVESLMREEVQVENIELDSNRKKISRKKIMKIFFEKNSFIPTL